MPAFVKQTNGLVEPVTQFSKRTVLTTDPYVPYSRNQFAPEDTPPLIMVQIDTLRDALQGARQPPVPLPG